MTMAKPTIKALQADIALYTKRYDESRTQMLQAKSEATEFKNQRDSVIAQFNDLKQRLVTAEAENQRMRGYIDRVQEDDVVREELVSTGDPEGEVHLAPKRKATRFSAPNPFSDTGALDHSEMWRRGVEGEPRRKPKHWVTY